MKNFALQKNFKIITILLFTVIALLASNSAFSQDFKVLGQGNNLARKSTTSKTTGLNEVNALVSQLLPTIYFLDGKVSTYGETSAIKLETDIQGIKSISEISSKLGSVKIAKIFLNTESDLNSTIDSELFNSGALKYIYVVSNFEVTESQIANMITPSNPDIIVLFSTSGK